MESRPEENWGAFDRVISQPSSGRYRADIDEELKLRIGDIDYVLFKTQDFAAPLQLSRPSSTVLSFVYPIESRQVITASALQEFRKQVLECDDVFHPRFYTTVVFYGSKKEDVNLEPEAQDVLRSWSTVFWVFIEAGTDPKPPPGPYVSYRGQTWQPWKVYRDFNGAFMCTFKPGLPSTGGLGGRVVVPSRCYFKPSSERPLDGVRVGIKDNIDIGGHKTTLNNRAWTQLYPTANKHANCVQRLADAGAIIVGKLKLQAMLVREEPSEAVEFTSPFNPRGDGYRTPSGSSSGSAAAIGAYDWLDLTLGSDTNGDITKPAQQNGCFGIRPTTGTIKSTGVVGHFPLFDTPGFFMRDISKFPAVINTLYGGSLTLHHTTPPSVHILYPEDWLPTASKDQTFAIDKFVAGVQKAFGAFKVPVSIAKRWKWEWDGPDEHKNLQEYLQDAGMYPYYKDSYKAFQSFRDEYRAEFGKQPFVHRYLQWQWYELQTSPHPEYLGLILIQYPRNTAKGITEEKRNECWGRLAEYRDFLCKNIFKWGGDFDSLNIMVLPIGDGRQPHERGALEPLCEILSGFSPLNMAPILRAPEVTAIVGEQLFLSDVTGRREPCPIAISVIGPPGEDLLLAKVVEMSMEAAGIPTKLKTGPSVYHDTYEQWSRRPKRKASDLDRFRELWAAQRYDF
ncbi:amidase [Xylariaceae sp. FL1272]|nr:amidase [Xylariaceae sp. FL1272]